MVIRLLIPALMLSSCATAHITQTYGPIDPITIQHRSRTFDVRYAYDLQPPEVLITRSLPESILEPLVRYGARQLELSDFESPEFALEKEYMKQAIGLTIKLGCSIARESDGSTKFFPVGRSANKYIATLNCD